MRIFRIMIDIQNGRNYVGDGRYKMVKFGEICDWIKKNDNAVEFVNLNGMGEFEVTSRITSKGKYKVTLEFDAKEMLKNPEGLPFKYSDFIYRPYILFIKLKEYQDSAKNGETK